MNNDGLAPGSFVSRGDYWRVYFEYREAETAVLRGEYADFATALAAIRA